MKQTKTALSPVEKLLAVAHRLEARNHPAAKEVMRIAQNVTGFTPPTQNFMGGVNMPGEDDRMADNNWDMDVLGFDPSSEPQGMPAQEMRSGASDGGENPHEGKEHDHEGAHKGLHPDISTFVQPRGGEGGGGGERSMVDETRTHTCTVTFKAPSGVEEHDMMNYVLGIDEALGVEVEGFRWNVSKKEAPAAPAVR